MTEALIRQFWRRTRLMSIMLLDMQSTGAFQWRSLPAYRKGCPLGPISSSILTAMVNTELFKRILQRCGALFFSPIVLQWASDPVSGFRAMTAAETRRVRVTNRISYTVEMLMRSIWGGSRVVFVPVSTNPTTRPSQLCRGSLRLCARQGGIAVSTLASILWQRYRPGRGGERSSRPVIPLATTAASVVR